MAMKKKTVQHSAAPLLDWRVQPYAGRTDLSANEVTVHSLARTEAKKGMLYDGFFLSGVQFGWCARGKLRLHVDDGKPIDVRRGQFAIVYGQRTLRTEVLEDDTAFTTVILGGLGSMAFVDELGLYDGFVAQDELPASSIAMLDDMVNRHKASKGVSNAIVMNLVANMLTSVVDHARIRGKAQFLDAVKCFDDHFLKNDFSVGSVADELGISPNTLYLLFRDHGLGSPGAFAESRQRRRAGAMLAYSRFKINEIARFCGFSSPAHFSVFVKRHFGHSPRELRNGTCDVALAQHAG